MIRAFFDPSAPVGVCGCGEVIDPHDDICAECLGAGIESRNLDPVAIAVVLILIAGIVILAPLVVGLYQTWRGA